MEEEKMAKKIKRLKHTRKVRKRRKDGVKQHYWKGKKKKANSGRMFPSLRVDKDGIIKGMGIEGDERRLSRRVRIYRLGEYSRSETLEKRKKRDAKKILKIYKKADPREVGIPKNVDEILVPRGARFHLFTNSRREVIGVGTLRVPKSYIKGVFILPSHRRKGYGKSIVKKLEDVLKANRSSFAYLFVRKRNNAAQRFWRAMGYTNTGEESESGRAYKFQKHFMTADASWRIHRTLRIV